MHKGNGSFKIALKIFAMNGADLFHASNSVTVEIKGCSQEICSAKIMNELYPIRTLSVATNSCHATRTKFSNV